MLKKLWLNLQLFGEGGDGGDGGSAASAGETLGGDSGEEKIPASIPEKAKKYYEKAMARKSTPAKTSQAAQTTNEPDTTGEKKQKLSYQDLIKSDDYKEEHKAYMDKTIGDRFKKYKGIEEDLGKHKEILGIVASKYGVNPDDENFLEVLNEKIEADDSYYENYAMEHDMDVATARQIVTMERRVAKQEAENEARQKQEQMQRHIMQLRTNAMQTKAQFPNFDLETEMQDEKFRRLCAVTNGDTTAAFMACHYNDIITSQVQMASRQIQNQTAQSVASNQARPIENGISSSAPSVVQQDFSKMSLKELRQYAEQKRREQTGR